MNRKQITAIILDIAVIICAVFCLYLLYYVMQPVFWRHFAAAALVLPVIALMAFERRCWSKKTISKKRTPSISTLVLLGEKDRPIKIWDLTGKVGILIGKSAQDYTVDIDLADSAYHSYIDEEHAILNYTETGWWLQDTSSRNGVSILRKGDELILGHHAPAQIEPGDIICLARYTRIAVN